LNERPPPPKYGLEWQPGTSALDIELDMIAKNQPVVCLIYERTNLEIHQPAGGGGQHPLDAESPQTRLEQNTPAPAPRAQGRNKGATLTYARPDDSCPRNQVPLVCS
jgi:hypothetical protein